MTSEFHPAGLHLHLQPQSSSHHPVSLCFLAPGVYTIYAYDVHQLQDTDLSSQLASTEASEPRDGKDGIGVLAVSPAYFLVE